MDRKPKIVLRINILYFLFFGMIAAFTIFTLFTGDFREGFKEGYRSTQEQLKAPHTVYNTVLEVPLARKANRFDTFIRQDSTVRIDARSTTVDIRVSGSPTFGKRTLGSVLLTVFGILCYVSILIIVFVMLILLRKSIRTGNIFAGYNIGFIRAIGFLLIIASLLCDFGRYLQIRTLSTLLQGSDWQISYDNIFTFRDIFIGVVILIIAEIFAIGHEIAEDQKLTI